MPGARFVVQNRAGAGGQLGFEANFNAAPDGYTFRSGADSYGGNVFDGLFFGSSRYRVQAELVKDGRSIRLPNTDGAHYGNTVRFVGWVLP